MSLVAGIALLAYGTGAVLFSWTFWLMKSHIIEWCFRSDSSLGDWCSYTRNGLTEWHASIMVSGGLALPLGVWMSQRHKKRAGHSRCQSLPCPR